MALSGCQVGYVKGTDEPKIWVTPKKKNQNPSVAMGLRAPRAPSVSVRLDLVRQSLSRPLRKRVIAPSFWATANHFPRVGRRLQVVIYSPLQVGDSRSWRLRVRIGKEKKKQNGLVGRSSKFLTRGTVRDWVFPARRRGLRSKKPESRWNLKPAGSLGLYSPNGRSMSS